MRKELFKSHKCLKNLKLLNKLYSRCYINFNEYSVIFIYAIKSHKFIRFEVVDSTRLKLLILRDLKSESYSI